MDINWIVNRTKNILLTPRTEWPIIAGEKAAHAQVTTSWLLPLSLISVAAAFIGYGFIGYSIGGIHFASVSLGIRQAVLQLVVIIGGAYITAHIINALAERYASEKNLDQAFSLVAYACAPACLGGFLQIIPSLASIGSLAGLYSLYLLYLGLPSMMKTPPEKNTGYCVMVLLCAVGVFLVLGILLGAILMRAW